MVVPMKMKQAAHIQNRLETVEPSVLKAEEDAVVAALYFKYCNNIFFSQNSLPKNEALCFSSEDVF